MNKHQMAIRLAIILGNGSDQEESRIFAHHMKRTEKQVRESLARWNAINSTSASEIRANCQFSGLGLR